MAAHARLKNEFMEDEKCYDIIIFFFALQTMLREGKRVLEESTESIKVKTKMEIKWTYKLFRNYIIMKLMALKS